MSGNVSTEKMDAQTKYSFTGMPNNIARKVTKPGMIKTMKGTIL